MADSTELDQRNSIVTAQSPLVYPKLRDWYLAQLRRQAIEQSVLAQMTPIARIESDRVFVEKLVLAANDSRADVSRVPAKPVFRRMLLLLVVLAGIILSVVAYFALRNWDFSGAAQDYFASSMGLLLFGMGQSRSSVGSAAVVCGLFCIPLICANVLPTHVIFRGDAGEELVSPGNQFSIFLLLVSIGLCLALCSSVQLPDAHLVSSETAWAALLLCAYCLRRRFTMVQEQVLLHHHLLGFNGLLPGDAAKERQSSTMTDVLQASREALEQSQTRERTIADFSKDMICAFGKDYSLVAVNQSCVNIIGFPLQDLLYRHLSTLLVEPDWMITERRFAEITDTNNQARFETRVLTNRGTLKDLSFSVEWSAREQLYFAIAHDITIERTAQRARQEFVATISHDVRIPLTAVLFGLDSLLQDHHGPLLDGQKVVIANAEQNNTRVISLLNELIDLEKSVDSQLTLNLSKFLLHDLFLSGAEQLSQQAEQMQVEILIEGQNYAVKADRDRVERVFVNLLSNALKHSGAGQQIVISTVARQKSIEVRVADHGPGIPKHLQSAVFERYVQLGLPGERAVVGSGLGLAICKALIEAHGSSIGVDSAEGKGSTFWFTLVRSE